MEKTGITAVIILNYNNYSDTINCIKSIEKINTAKIKYIIVDNGSPNPQIISQLNDYFKITFSNSYLLISDNDIIPPKLPHCTFLTSHHNSGYACGNKKGLNIAYHDDEIDTILILNNDVVFVDDFIEPLYKTLWNCEKNILVTPLILKRDGKSIDLACARRKKSYIYLIAWFLFIFKDILGIVKKMNHDLFILDKEKDLSHNILIEMPSGSCFMVKKKDFKCIDDFDPNTFLYYEEDILSEKIYKYGKQCILVPKYKCIHLGASSTNKSPSYFIFKKSIESARYYVKNYMNISYPQYLLFHFITSVCLFLKYTASFLKK